MSNRKERKKQRDKVHAPLPWRAIDDVVVDANGDIVKAPHGCSWEGDNYVDDSSVAQKIVEAVNKVYNR